MSRSRRMPGSDWRPPCNSLASGMSRARASTSGPASNRERSTCTTATVASSIYGAIVLAVAAAAACPSAWTGDVAESTARRNTNWIDRCMVSLLKKLLRPVSASVISQL